MIRDKKRLNQVFYVFLNICLVFALTMQFERPKYNLYSGDLAWLRDIVMNLRQSLKNTSFFTLFICWLPHILINYPGSMCRDAWNQISAFFGVINFTSHHPPAHTWLISSFVKLGWTLGNTEWGLFSIVLLQSIIFAAILAYVFITMKKLKTPRWLIVMTWLIAVISPIYTTYIETILKDVIYSYMFLLFMIELVYIILDGEKYWKSIRHIGLLAISMTLVILFRNNGKYIIYPMSFVLIIMIIREYKKCLDKQILIRGISAIVISLFLAAGSEEFLIFHYNIQNGSIREALSLPFQQTARYIVEYGDEVTDEEKKL